VVSALRESSGNAGKAMLVLRSSLKSDPEGKSSAPSSPEKLKKTEARQSSPAKPASEPLRQNLQKSDSGAPSKIDREVGSPPRSKREPIVEATTRSRQELNFESPSRLKPDLWPPQKTDSPARPKPIDSPLRPRLREAYSPVGDQKLVTTTTVPTTTAVSNVTSISDSTQFSPPRAKVPKSISNRLADITGDHSPRFAELPSAEVANDGKSLAGRLASISGGRSVSPSPAFARRGDLAVKSEVPLGSGVTDSMVKSSEACSPSGRSSVGVRNLVSRFDPSKNDVQEVAKRQLQYESVTSSLPSEKRIVVPLDQGSAAVRNILGPNRLEASISSFPASLEKSNAATSLASHDDLFAARKGLESKENLKQSLLQDHEDYTSSNGQAPHAARTASMDSSSPTQLLEPEVEPVSSVASFSGDKPPVDKLVYCSGSNGITEASCMRMDEQVEYFDLSPRGQDRGLGCSPAAIRKRIKVGNHGTEVLKRIRESTKSALSQRNVAVAGGSVMLAVCTATNTASAAAEEEEAEVEEDEARKKREGAAMLEKEISEEMAMLQRASAQAAEEELEMDKIHQSLRHFKADSSEMAARAKTLEGEQAQLKRSIAAAQTEVREEKLRLESAERDSEKVLRDEVAQVRARERRLRAELEESRREEERIRREIQDSNAARLNSASDDTAECRRLREELDAEVAKSMANTLAMAEQERLRSEEARLQAQITQMRWDLEAEQESDEVVEEEFSDAVSEAEELFEAPEPLEKRSSFEAPEPIEKRSSSQTTPERKKSSQQDIADLIRQAKQDYDKSKDEVKDHEPDRWKKKKDVEPKPKDPWAAAFARADKWEQHLADGRSHKEGWKDGMTAEVEWEQELEADSRQNRKTLLLEEEARERSIRKEHLREEQHRERGRRLVEDDALSMEAGGDDDWIPPQSPAGHHTKSVASQPGNSGPPKNNQLFSQLQSLRTGLLESQKTPSAAPSRKLVDLPRPFASEAGERRASEASSVSSAGRPWDKATRLNGGGLTSTSALSSASLGGSRGSLGLSNGFSVGKSAISSSATRLRGYR